METFFTLLTLCEGNPPITGGFPLQTPATQSFNIFFDMRLNKRFSKQSKRRRFETQLSILWRHCTLVAISSQKRMQLTNWNADQTSSTKMVEKISRDFATLTKLSITNFFMTCLLSRSYHILVFMLYMTTVSPTGILVANVIRWSALGACILFHKATATISIMRAWWRHQMETFSALLAFVRGLHRSPVNSPHKGQWRVALMFSLICDRINSWVNNREAGDLRRYLTHYDVTVMVWHYCWWVLFKSHSYR